MSKSNTTQHSFGRFFNLEYFTRLSTLREDSQEDNQEIIIRHNSFDTSEYDIIESIEECNSPDKSIDVLSIADLLNERFAFLTGGTSENCPILTFPDNPFNELTQGKYKRLVTYLTQIPSEHERQLGFIIIIDRRSDRWMTVKSILTHIENYFPYSIQSIYLLRPSSWMQRALSQFIILSNKISTHSLIICESLAELHEYIHPSQLSKDLGGFIDFRLFDWIEQRAIIEKLTQSVYEFSEMVSIFIKFCDQSEFPDAVELTQKILIQHLTQKNELEHELRRIQTWGQSLLCIIRQEHKQSSSSSQHNILDKNNDIQHQRILSPDRSAHARACLDTLTHLDCIQSILLQFWSRHKTRLNHCLALRHFEQRFQEIQTNFQQLTHEFQESPDINTIFLVSDSYRSTTTTTNNNHNCKEDIDQISIQLDDLWQRTETMINHSTLLTNDGLALIMEQQKQQSTFNETNTIEPKRQELEIMKQKLVKQIDEKRQNLKILKLYIDKLSSINDWCLRGKDMLAMHPIHLSNEKAMRSLAELEYFLTDLSTMNIEELQHTSATEPLRSMIIQVFHRVNDVRDLCEKRCGQLRQLAMPISRPIQRVCPLSYQQNDPSNLVNTSTPMLRRQQHLSSLDMDSHLTSISTNESNIKMDKKQRHVVTELLVTEQVYVEELRTIIEGYMVKFDDPELLNKSVLFSNLPDIYAFHDRVFLRDLQQIYANSILINPGSIGSAIASCFIKRKSNFQLYEQYVLNKCQSERIWEQYCSGHSFFIKIQQSLHHRLPLDSYLLKPIQRITQYQLLLKEMIKYTRQEQERIHLQDALSVMLNILSHLNDVMHLTQIVGYPDNFNSLGQMRLRTENCIISKEKRRGTVYTRTKTSTRDIFLFERVILLCKKRDEGNGKSIQYQFKETIKIVDIAVCTHPKNDRKRIEIVLKDYSYIIQFPSNAETIEEISIRWIDTIKNCVTKQTEQRRAEIKQRSSSLDHSSHAHRRRLQNRIITSIRTPDSDDEQDHLPIKLIDLNTDDMKQNHKMIIGNSISHL
ncbi:hypothetical protein I4U23_024721 [Adineta vaga]|nr:hypothetical protein I4U23_024721 [Adineta vaga]